MTAKEKCRCRQRSQKHTRTVHIRRVPMMVGRFLLNSASPPDVPLAMRDLSFFVRCVCRDPLPPRDPRLNGGNAWIADVRPNQLGDPAGSQIDAKGQGPTWRQIERGQFAGVSGTNALHCTGTTRRTPHHSRCLCSVSLESSSAITVYPIVHALQSKQSDQGDLFL
jgi:hypothetical protein